MNKNKPQIARMLCSGTACVLAGWLASTAQGRAQTAGQGPATTITPAPAAKHHAAPAPKGELRVSHHHATSPDVVINLINLMVENKLIKEQQATALIKQAEDQAYVARQATKDAAAKAARATQVADAATAAVTPPGTKRVVYVPEYVKRQLRDELRQEVLRTARVERWASPGLYPEWASRIKFSGDFRTRYEGIFYPHGNAQGALTNFNAINTGSPFDVSEANPIFAPTLDSTQNRNEFRIRARLGAEADLSNGFTTGFRIATGSDNSPVSTNQTLGGSGGNFSKYELWLDRAYLNYDPWQGRPWGDVNISIGRFDNPFFASTDLVWYRDIAFDGAAIQARHIIYGTGFTPFIVAGAFPTFNTNLNFQSSSAQDFGSEDRYLIAAQIGTAWAINPDINALFGVSYYDFTNIQGQLSQPCLVASSASVCSTDDLRPSFAQNGNTYMALRNIIPTSGTGGNDNNTINQFQYFGLASAFREVDVSGRIDFGYFHPINVVLDGEFVDNTAFNSAATGAIAVNNRAGTPDGSLGNFAGGNIGWMTRLTVGHEELKQFGDWNANVGYKYIQSDAAVDAFEDPDFGLGGTNLKGYQLGANFAFASNVWTTVRWLSAQNIGGAPYNVDVLQVDLNAKY